MPLKTLHGPEQIPIDALRGKTISIIGFGNQGRAHALNLRDSGLSVCIGLRPGSNSGQEAADMGFNVTEIPQAVTCGDLVILAIPDEAQRSVFETDIKPALRHGCILGFLHGFSVHFGFVQPPEDVGIVMIAPKGPGVALRMRYEQGLGLPCLMAIEQESPNGDARAISLAWAAGIGAAQASVVETTFAVEAETDLFGEQAVLCGGLAALLHSGFETLVSAGYPPEIAYLECCQEIKQIADLVFERGMTGMLKAISTTAEFGSLAGRQEVTKHRLDQAMKNLLDAVQDGSFALAMQQQYDKGSTILEDHRDQIAGSDLEAAGKAVRSWMPWLNDATPSHDTTPSTADQKNTQASGSS